jgi:hypothetical protein
VAAHPSGLIAASASLDMGQVRLLNRRERQGKKEERDEREMEIKLKWKFCFFWVEAEEEDGEIGEEEDERDAGEREKKSEKNVWLGEREKSNFFKKVKSKKYYFNDIRNG